MHYGTPPWYIAEGLLEVRRRSAEARIPPSVLDDSLNFATWNIREFGRVPRLEASIYYIAEMINRFDLVALTELRDNLADLRRVMRVLGEHWQVVFSDFSQDRGGNNERIAYLYDTRMVTFTGLAAEADPPRVKVAGEYLPKFTWWRSPYMASFQSGSFDFVLLTAHIRWGKKISERVRTLEEFRKWVVKRRARKFVLDRDFIVTGDFNVPHRKHAAYRALTGAKGELLLPEGLLAVKGTNLSRRNTYDQILHSPTKLSQFSGVGGVLDFYRDDWQALYPNPEHRPANQRKFTYELSDHLPLWLQIKTNITDKRLAQLAKTGNPDG